MEADNLPKEGLLLNVGSFSLVFATEDSIVEIVGFLKDF